MVELITLQQASVVSVWFGAERVHHLDETFVELELAHLGAHSEVSAISRVSDLCLITAPRGKHHEYHVDLIARGQ